MGKISYVYYHVNNVNDEIFYIGIGSDKNYARSKSRNNRNRVWHNYVSKYPSFRIEIMHDNLLRFEACKIEEFEIKNRGRLIDNTGRLCNISFGGERTFYGMIRTKEHTQKIIDKLKGRKLSNEIKNKFRIAKLGKKMSDESKKKNSDAQKLIIHTEERNKKISIALSGIKRGKMSDEHKNKISDSLKIRGCGKRIMCLNNKMEYISIEAAAKDLGIKPNHIPCVCIGRRPHTSGYKFIYI